MSTCRLLLHVALGAITASLGSSCTVLFDADRLTYASDDGGTDAGTTDAGPEDGGLDAGSLGDAGSQDGGNDGGGTAPATPAPLSPWLGSHVQRAPTLRWAAASDDATSYDVQLAYGCAPPSRAACAFDPSLTEMMSTSETEWNPGALLVRNPTPPRNRPYAWRVRACRGGVCSGWSDVWYFVFGSRNDVDGSGTPDLLVGVSGDEVRVYRDALAASEWVISGISSGTDGRDRFGSTIAGIGDVNGDGFSDFVVGASSEDWGGADYDPGRAYLMLGGLAAPTTAHEILSMPSAGNFSVFGWSICALGDLNGDGFADFAVGANAPVRGVSFAGVVFIYFGGASGLSGPMRIDSPEEATQVGFSRSIVSVGDINGDGLPDFAVGGPQGRVMGERVGRVWIFETSPSGVLAAGRPVEAPLTDPRVSGFGSQLAVLHTPTPTLVVSAPGDTDRQGRVFGFALSDTSVPAWAIEAAVPGFNDRYGSILANAGDTDADGTDDLMIGDFDNADVVRTPGTTPTTRLAFLTDHRRLAGVGDIDGDGTDDVAGSTSSMLKIARGARVGGFAEPPRFFTVPAIGIAQNVR